MMSELCFAEHTYLDLYLLSFFIIACLLLGIIYFKSSQSYLIRRRDLIKFKSIGVEIFRPSLETELAVRKEVESVIRGKYASKTYTGKDIINRILQDYYAFYDDDLKRLLPKIASMRMMEFVLDQYDKTCELEKLKTNLDESESQYWSELGPNLRRALKYLAECITMLVQDEPPQIDEYEFKNIKERCWICCEQLVELSQLSTQTFVLFPDDTTLDIRPEGELEWFVLTLNEPERYQSYKDRISQDTATRNKVIDEHETLYNQDRLARLIDPTFEAEFGLTLTDTLSFAFNLNKNAVQPGEGFDIPFVSEQQINKALVKKGNITPEQAKVIIDGLCLRKAEMQNEGREVLNPKQEYRANVRPFFEFPHETGTHFIWSRKMADECLMRLFSRLAQKLVPREWSIGRMAKALGSYEQEITKLFEDIVIKRLTKEGLSASRFKSQIGLGSKRIIIPDGIGEIDLLAYWEEEELLIVGDDKLVKPTHEPATYRDDISKFIGKNKSYVDQVERKTQWVVDNIQNVLTALESADGFPKSLKVKKVAPLLVTYYPAFASCFIDEMPCVALSELITEIKTKQSWPYSPVHHVGA